MPICKKCGQEIRWVRTAKGKMMPLQADDHEPHFPHCGKNLWTPEQWDEYRKEIQRKTVMHNRRTRKNHYLMTNPSKKTDDMLYRGERPPWDYPNLIDCVKG